MERLTVNDLGKVCYDPWDLCGIDGYCTKGCHEVGGCTKGCHILKMYQKLAEYEDLEEQGKLLKLPCVVGTPVYYIQGNCEGVPKELMFVDRTFFSLDMLSKMGSEFFLTKEEAENALEKLKEKKRGKFNKEKFLKNAPIGLKKHLKDHLDVLDGMEVIFDGRFGHIPQYFVDGEEYYLYPVLIEWCDI